MADQVASLAALLQQGWKESGYQPNYRYIDLRTLADWLERHGVTVGEVSAAPRCPAHLWAVSCGHTSCPLHGPWETKWSGRGPSAERAADFQRMVLGIRE